MERPNHIKFSSDYNKLWGQRQAKLMYVLKINGNNLHEDLIEYDTTMVDGKKYKLPKTDLLYLLFVGDKQIPFCTLRRYTYLKNEWYRSKIGQMFDIIIGGEDGKKEKK